MMRSTRSATLLLFAVFAVGALSGVGAAVLLARNGVIDARPPRGPTGGFVGHLTRRLDLTDAQRDSVRAILERSRPAMDSLRREMRPRLETLQAEMRSAIHAQLTPDQQRRFTEMTKRYEAKRAEREDPHVPR
jgi:Spy/CpxP family protein refolding chaperone